MTDRLSMSEYKRLTAQMSVSATGRVVQVAKPSPEFAAAFAKATHVLHKPQTLPASVKPNKYGAKKTLVDGITFDSKLEARRYVQLMEMQRHSLIRELQRQVRYSLDVNSKKIGTYIADFVYTDKTGAEVIEDAKGVLTPLYRRSKKHFQAQYGKTIVEVTK